ncbi:hypothetical protein KCM76_25650 [Zooshikella marina]|uniref:hypothetical protein n=1 Tax=Zooshikella ganghwensis TaxID=202772 RepID=UPI001BB012A9|nr:hypothetical protein [Zooshikella ganghwensis]MBU2709402.1 hypothetical protein [Zooshikella ganghwensis]
MSPEELKIKLESIASEFMSLSNELEELESKLTLNMDKKAVSEIILNLHWAAENITVISLHQVGKALDDNMGTGLKD